MGGEGGEARAPVEECAFGVVRVAELDAVAHVLLAGVPTARNASLAMGRNLLRLALESFAGEGGFQGVQISGLQQPGVGGHGGPFL